MVVQVSGSKFYYLKNEAVLLEMALINWTISEVTRRGFTPLITPEILRSSVVEKCGFQPRGENKQISSASNCTDYQSQRLGIRYRPEASSTRSPKKGKGNLAPTQFVHTLNAKACAVPRMMICLLENFQQDGGSVIIPRAIEAFYWRT
ncbi:hypothetical protein Vadar_023254 [Vaccinium darrowii]|uniref:Uncharacterized protein n=1 Tax=Vaccinium darrowii TaxID=229202 RepID=A0ACB7YYK0_9ERIC|nr:hypothetical protein Vadar_023254 [Vaccinium darrowii]